MNTLEFFQTILPSEGVYYLALIEKGTGKVVHKPFTDLTDMASAVGKFNTDDRFNTYHACSSYQEASIELDGKRKFRVPENWGRAKAFWIDLDCGAEKAAKGDGYPTKKDAVVAVSTFCKQQGIPQPMLVDSGNGIHCYWPLTKSIKHEAWRKIAYAFKAVLSHFGVLADPTCTADFSRILRPVGSFNKKKDAKEVKLLKNAEPIDPAVFAGIIRELVKLAPAAVEAPQTAPAGLNDDLLGHAYPEIPTYAEEVANRCAQVSVMRDTKGDVNYEHWRGVIGIIKHCEEGIELAADWSSRRAETGHTQNDILVRYETWSSGPTTCEFFSKCNPKGCEGCPSAGKVKSPIMLGRIIPEPEVEVVEASVDGKIMEVEIPELPRGYGHQDDRMVRFMKSPDDIVVAIEFSTNLFYPTYRVRKESGEYAMQMRMHLPNSKTRDFDIDTAILASKQKLLEGLARYELIPTNNKDAEMHLTAYVRDSLEKLKREADELNTMTAFGWKDDYTSFLVGDRLYHSDGTVRKVLISGGAKKYATFLQKCIGSVQGYSDALNYLYAREGQEHMQYTLGSFFGSVLTPLCSNNLYRGMLYALVGGKTGKGKTTVCQAGLYFYGTASGLIQNGEEGATTNASNLIFSTMHNLPYLLDEFTNITPEALSRLSYSCANGADRERLTVSRGAGVQFMETGSWAMNPHITANTDLLGRLATDKVNSAAEAVRLMQIDMDHYPHSGLEVADVLSAMKRIELNQGIAGDLYIKYLVTHREEVMKKMAKWAARISTTLTDPRFRFYYAHAECSLAALEVTNELGITQFDLEAIWDFTIALIRKLDTTISHQNSSSPEDALGSMITALSGRIIVTVEYRDSRSDKGPEIPRRVFGTVAGRYITGSPTSKSALSGKLFISHKEAQDWCKDNRVDLKEIITYAESVGVLVPYKERFTIGRGTDIKTGNVPCICLDQAKLEDMVGKNLFGGDGKVSSIYAPNTEACVQTGT